MSEKELYGKITKGVYNFPEHMSSSACDLVRRILNLTPAYRPTAEEILADVWFNHGIISYEDNFDQSSLLTPSSTIPKILCEI
jgi:serine/threonine protein kinase